MSSRLKRKWALATAVGECKGCKKKPVANDDEDDEEAEGTPSVARDADQHYFLRRTHLAELDLSPVQRTKLNALVYGRRPLEPWLTPRQLTRLRELERGDE